MDHSRKHQAITYALEAVIEAALRQDFGLQGETAIALWQRLDPSFPGVFEKLNSRGALFSSWNKTKRKKYFLNLMQSFDSTYEMLYAFRVENGESDLLAPEQIEQWKDAEWPDPRW